MVVQAEQDRVKHLLAEALPMLCRSGLSFASEFCIEALIGITLDKNDVFLVSIKETVQTDKCIDVPEKRIDVSVSKVPPGDSDCVETGPSKKSPRKRKHSSGSPRRDSVSDQDVDDAEDPTDIKHLKVETEADPSDFDTSNSIGADTDEPKVEPHLEDESAGLAVIKAEPPDADEIGVSFSDMGSGQEYDITGFQQTSFHSTLKPLASSTFSSSDQLLSGMPHTQAVPPVSDHLRSVQFDSSHLGIGQQDMSREQSGSHIVPAEYLNMTGDAMAAAPYSKVDENRWICQICASICSSKRYVIRHIKTIHLKEQPFQCSFCPRRFGHKHSQQRHEKGCLTRKRKGYPNIVDTPQTE